MVRLKYTRSRLPIDLIVTINFDVRYNACDNLLIFLDAPTSV